MVLGYVMKVSSNGQVSIPAEVRARWQTDRVVVADLGDRVVVADLGDRVVVADLGDRVVMRPLAENPLEALRGKYQSRGPSTDSVRRQERAAEAAADRKR